MNKMEFVMKRNKRQEAIIDIINSQEVSTQSELTDILKQRGFSATQATVSRDINELELIKAIGQTKKFKYTVRPEKTTMSGDKFANIFKESVLSIESSLNLIVIKTCEGSASGAAYFLDKLDSYNILGTISGDDTILIVARKVECVPELIHMLKGFLK